jgi:isochorismate pyruvate lyase
MKAPEDCLTLQEIRAEIDRIDRQVIAAWSQRFAYVKAASKFKTDATTVQAPERLATMLQQRRDWASAAGLNPDVIENLYRDLVGYFIQEELQSWQSN